MDEYEKALLSLTDEQAEWAAQLTPADIFWDWYAEHVNA